MISPKVRWTWPRKVSQKAFLWAFKGIAWPPIIDLLRNDASRLCITGRGWRLRHGWGSNPQICCSTRAAKCLDNWQNWSETRCGNSEFYLKGVLGEIWRVREIGRTFSALRVLNNWNVSPANHEAAWTFVDSAIFEQVYICSIFRNGLYIQKRYHSRDTRRFIRLPPGNAGVRNVGERSSPHHEPVPGVWLKVVPAGRGYGTVLWDVDVTDAKF